MITIGENIRKKRAEYDIEQKELAARCNVSKTLICNIELGLKIPSVLVLMKIADALHCSTDELLGRKVG